MRLGPEGLWQPGEFWVPRWRTPLPDGCDSEPGDDVCTFIEAMCRSPKDTIAGKRGSLLKVRPWQRALITDLFATKDGVEVYRQALVGVARKNGKSAVGSSLGLHGLLLGPEGAEVYSCAGDKDQARIVFGVAKQMVLLDPQLEDAIEPFKDALEVKETGSVYRVVSSDAPLKEGLNPTLVIFDELHVQKDDDLWNVMTLGGGAREAPLTLALTTAGVRTNAKGEDTPCYRLYQHGKKVVRGEVEDPTFYFCWWEPKAGTSADHRSPEVWKEANPGFDDIVSEADFRSVVVKMPEAEFRTKRTNVFVSSKESALPFGWWDICADPARVVDPTEQQVLAFDGSWHKDCTCVVSVTLDGHISVVALWEQPDGDEEWRVPVAEVEEVLLKAAAERNVLEVAADPYRWQRSISVLRDEHGLAVEEFPSASLPRIVPAWTRFYDAVADSVAAVSAGQARLLTHDGNPALARHVDNMVLKRDTRGVRPVKEAQGHAHIDLGIASVIGYDRATWWREQPVEPFGGFA